MFARGDVADSSAMTFLQRSMVVGAILVLPVVDMLAKCLQNVQMSKIFEKLCCFPKTF